MYIDSHTHLNTKELFENWENHITEFEKIGGEVIVNSGADDEYNQNGIMISKKYHGNVTVKATVGFHPYEAVCGYINDDNLETKMEELKFQYFENKENIKHIVAVGECGIDTHYKGGRESIILQQKLLKSHCDLAREFNLPIVIHSREDFGSTMEILKDYGDLKIYFHCRGYGPNEIKILQDNFKKLWIGFCGNVTYKNAQNIRDSLAVVDQNKILIETDAPYLSPQVIRGQTNYPANVRYIYDFIENELQIEKSKLLKIIKENCVNLYFK